MFDYNAETGTIRAYGVIGPYEDGIDEADFMQAFDEIGGGDVTIVLKSPGGSVDSGQSIYNQIQNYPGHVTVHVDAAAHSIASYFPMAADDVTVSENAVMMVHDPWTVAMGNSREMRGVAEVLDVLADVIAQGYAEKSGRHVSYWRQIMEKDTYFNASEALEVGLVDGIAKSVTKPRRAAAETTLAPVATLPAAFATKQIAARLRLRTKNG